MVPCEKPKIIYFASLKKKNIVVFPACSRFIAKLICCISFGSASNTYCFYNFL